MAKKASGKSYTSKGQHSNVARGTLSDMRKTTTKTGQRVIDKIDAYLAGKNPWITIPNPNKKDTSRRFIRVRADDHYGNPKDRNRGYIHKEAQQ